MTADPRRFSWLRNIQELCSHNLKGATRVVKANSYFARARACRPRSRPHIDDYEKFKSNWFCQQKRVCEYSINASILHISLPCQFIGIVSVYNVLRAFCFWKWRREAWANRKASIVRFILAAAVRRGSVKAEWSGNAMRDRIASRRTFSLEAKRRGNNAKVSIN